MRSTRQFVPNAEARDILLQNALILEAVLTLSSLKTTKTIDAHWVQIRTQTQAGDTKVKEQDRNYFRILPRLGEAAVQ
jgi:hypothetical protein